MKNYDFNRPLGDYEMGILFLIINNVPEVSHRTYYRTLCFMAKDAQRDDPFAIVFLQSEQGNWYKGEYCYADCRHKFIPVGLAAVPDVILMMNMVKP